MINSGSYRPRIHGPVPTVGPDLRFPFTATASGVTIAARASASFSNSSASGIDVSITRVASSIAVIDETVFRRSLLWNEGSWSRSRLKTMSEAAIFRPRSGSRSCQFTSWRKTTVRLSVSSMYQSAQMSQSTSPANEAATGSNLSLSESSPTRGAVLFHCWRNIRE